MRVLRTGAPVAPRSLNYYTTRVNKYESVGPTAPPTSSVDASRAADVLLTALVNGVGACTVPDLVGRLGMHANTVRTRLGTLVEEGLVERETLPARGRGRPAHAFRASGAGRAALRVDSVFAEYRGLSAAFVDHLAQAPGDPTEQARSVGRAWGRQLLAADSSASAQDRGGSIEASGASTGVQDKVVGVLADMRFDPSPDDDGIALRTCPLLDVAQRVPQVICEVHRGLVEGALQHYGAAQVAVELVPFAEPGACRLRLG